VFSIIVAKFCGHLTKKCINISNEVRSLTEELKTGPEEVIKKKINRPISLGKEDFPREMKNYFLF